MADYQDDYSGGLPPIPSQGGIPLGAGNTVNPVGGGMNPEDQKRADYYRRVLASPLYQIGVALSGRDFISPQLQHIQGNQLAQDTLTQRKSEAQTHRDAANAQIAEHGANLHAKFQEMLDNIPDEEQKSALAKQFIPILQSVYKPIMSKDQQSSLLDPDVIEKSLTNRDYMQALKTSMPFLDEGAWKILAKAKPKEREGIARNIVEAQVQPMMKSIGQAAASLPPKEDGSRYTLDEARAALKTQFDDRHEAAFDWWMANTKKDQVDQVLANKNIEPFGTQSKKELKGGAQKLSDLGLNQNIGPYLGQAGWDTSKNGAATPDNLMLLSKADPATYSQIITKAEQLRKAAEVKAATEIGVGIQKGAIVATNAELLDMPLTDPRVPGSNDWESKRFIYDSSGRPTPAAGMTGRQLRDARNSGAAVVLDDKEHIAVQGANVALGTINKFGQIAEQLPEGAGQNFRKLATERLKNLLGKDNLQAQLDGMRTSVMTAVRGAQGSAQNISNKDVEQVQRSFTTLWDGKQSARARLTAYRDLVNLSRDASLRRLDPGAIQAKWDSIMKNMDEGSVTGATRVR